MDNCALCGSVKQTKKYPIQVENTNTNMHIHLCKKCFEEIKNNKEGIPCHINEKGG